MTIRLLWLLTGLILISFTSNIKELKSREMYLPKPGAKRMNLGLVRATLCLAPELKWVLVVTFCCSHTISQVLQCYSGRTYPRTSRCLLTLHFAHATDSNLSLKVGLSEGFDVTPPWTRSVQLICLMETLGGQRYVITCASWSWDGPTHGQSEFADNSCAFRSLRAKNMFENVRKHLGKLTTALLHEE